MSNFCRVDSLSFAPPRLCARISVDLDQGRGVLRVQILRRADSLVLATQLGFFPADKNLQDRTKSA